jgi:hypothetical protein
MLSLSENTPTKLTEKNIERVPGETERELE